MKTGESRHSSYSSRKSDTPAKDIKKNRLFNAVLIFLAFSLSCTLIVFGSYFHFGQDVQGITVGLPSTASIRAPREVENTIATEHNRQVALDRANNLLDIMDFDPQVWATVEHNLNILAGNVDAIREIHSQEIEAFGRLLLDADADFLERLTAFDEAMEEWNALRDNLIAENGDISELPPQPEQPEREVIEEPEFSAWLMFDQLPVRFSETHQEIILSMDIYAYTQLWEAIFDVAYNTQATVISEVGPLTLDTMRGFLGAWALDQNTREIVEAIVRRYLTANQVINVEATQSARDAIANNYQRVTLMENQTIVNIGEIVTEEIYAILTELGMLEDTTVGDLSAAIGGAFFIVALLFMACLIYLSSYRPTIVTIKREAFLLFTLYAIVLVAVWALRDAAYPFLPILVFPMLASMLIDRRSAVVLSFSMTMASYFIVAGSWDFLMFFLISGFVIAMLSRFTTDRNKIFLVGITVAIFQFTLSISIAFIMDINLALFSVPGLLTTAGFAALNGLLTVIISTGSLPIWETFFGVVTPVKLLDLTNPTNLLLRRLTIEAPGTYHHSLIVANLAESAAYDIGANAHAARVGGYYHDIGKLKFPQYFAENLDGDNPHDHLDPIDSARLILSHVSYGLTLATEHRLPQFVRDIIQEHHGGSILQFFYHKAKDADPQVDINDYKYPYPPPQTRESACVTLADSVEAAVRAMVPKLKSVSEMEDTIRKLVRHKLMDGGLAYSQLSIRDVEVIEESFIRVLKGMYHERISYPKLVPVEDAEPVISPSAEE